MSEEGPKLDIQRAHRHFAVECFNHAWTYIDKPERTAEDNDAMVMTAMASLWHWIHRADCTNRNLSIGHWQLSRVMALVGHGEAAMRHALQSLVYSEGSPPFYIGYAHEAAARAALLLNDHPGFDEHLATARSLAAGITEADERAALEQDLDLLVAAATSAA